MNIIATISKLNEKRIQLETAELPSNVIHLRIPGLKTISGYIKFLVEVAQKQWLNDVDLPETITDSIAWHNVEVAAKENGASDYEAACLAKIKEVMYWVVENRNEN